jgi:predicted PurR-regulated permease PerM
MFWWLGLPAPLMWGTVMGVLALVPVLGAFVVWLPAAFFLVMDGSWGQALVLTLWGLLVVGTIDNLLRPILVGKRLKLPTVLAFISVLGGLLQFGAAGLILGPAILAATTVLLEIWSGRALEETSSHSRDETSSHSRDETSSHSRTLWRAAAPVSGYAAQAPSDLPGARADQ